MEKTAQSGCSGDCRSCTALQGHLADHALGDVDGPLRGPRLVIAAMLCFLLPLCTAGIGIALAGPGAGAQTLACVLGLFFGAGVCVIGRRVSRRLSVSE